jgi:hypothetical protein
MANRYKKIAKADQKNVDGGYKNVVQFAPRDTFTLIAAPDSAVTTPGASVEIPDDHTFGASDGFISWLCNTDSVTVTGKSEGRGMIWTSVFELVGDSSSTQEQVQDQLNDNCIFLLKDANCKAATELVQLGDDCNTPKVEVEFDGKTTASGDKIYKITLTVKNAKYFYQGTVTSKP